MPTIDPCIDAYIAAAPGFARPILEQAQAIVHEACPHGRRDDEVEHADLRLRRRHPRRHGGVKQHATFGFWKHALVVGEGASVPA